MEIKSKNIYAALILLGITLLALWGINRAYIYLHAIDAIEQVEVDKDGNVKGDSKANIEEELFIQRLSNPRAGDIYLIKEGLDSFSFFQIGNVDSTDLIPIFKGAYDLKDSVLLASEVEDMSKFFPNHFDTSDIYDLSRRELRTMNKAGEIQQIYRQDGKLNNVRPNKEPNTTFLMAFIFLIQFLAFVTLIYLGIWLANYGKTNFEQKKSINKVITFIGIAFLLALVGEALTFGREDELNLLFRFIRNLGTVFMFYGAYSMFSKFFKNRFSYLKYQLLLAGGLIISAVFIEIINQFLWMFYKEGRFETNLMLLFDLEDNPTIVIDFFGMLYFSIANLIYSVSAHQKKLTLNQKEFEITRLNALKSKAELEALTAKTNPHFLYNSLNTIAALAKIDAEKTEKMALALSKFLKYSTNRQGTNLVSLMEEIEMVETYLSVEKIRFEDQLEYQISVDKTLENIKVPRFLLQPLVENALKHGYQSASQKIFISVEAVQAKKGMVLKIRDSGLPFPDDFTGGYGLDGVSKKLFLLFPNRHYLELLNEPEKMVRITLW